MRLYAMCTSCGRAIASGMAICHACRRASQVAVTAKKKQKPKNHNARKPRRQHD